MGVTASRRRYIAQVGTEILVAHFAVMLRVGDMHFSWPPRCQVANIVQSPQVNVFPRRHILATRAAALWLVPGFFDNLGLRQVFNACVRYVGYILPRTRPG